MSGNPFLLPPGGSDPADEPVTGAAAQPTAPVTARPDPAPSTDQSGYIAVPASVESATHRIARPEPPPAGPQPVAPAAVSVPAAVRDLEPLAEETQVAAPRRWMLLLPDGVRVSLEEPLLLGRDPAGIPDRPDAGLLPVVDRGKTVSKTHALLEPDPAGVRVRELHSTNGVAIDTPAGRRLLSPGGDSVAPLGATIMLGSFAIVVATG